MPESSFEFKELGLSGLKRTGRYVYQEFLPQLSGSKAVKVYEEMRENDPIVGALLFAIDMYLRGMEWHVEPGGKSDEDAKAAEFLEQCRDDMSHTWSDFISEALTMLPYGWAYHEIVYKLRRGQEQTDPRYRSQYDDGKIGWRKLPLRSQTSFNGWEFDDDGGVKGMFQLAPPTYQETYIPIEKALLFRTSSQAGNPEGRSILRNAYLPWWYKKRISEIEAIGIERDLAGLPVIDCPPELLAEDAEPELVALKNTLMDLVKNIRRDQMEGVLFPLAYDDRGNKLYDLRLLTSGGSRQFNTDAIVARYDQRIAMVVLADFILLGHENVGSFALSDDKTDMFAVALGAWADSIEQTINRFAVPRLFEVNDWKLDKLPQLKHGDIEKPDLTKLGAYITQLVQAGAPIFPNDALLDYLLESANLPERPEDLVNQQQEVDDAKRQAELDALKNLPSADAAQEAKAPTEGGPQPSDNPGDNSGTQAKPPVQ